MFRPAAVQPAIKHRPQLRVSENTTVKGLYEMIDKSRIDPHPRHLILGTALNSSVVGGSCL
jgi:hypothetical protein